MLNNPIILENEGGGEIKGIEYIHSGYTISVSADKQTLSITFDQTVNLQKIVAIYIWTAFDESDFSSSSGYQCLANANILFPFHSFHAQVCTDFHGSQSSFKVSGVTSGNYWVNYIISLNITGRTLNLKTTGIKFLGNYNSSVVSIQ